jgi:hypothetical protein
VINGRGRQDRWQTMLGRRLILVPAATETFVGRDLAYPIEPKVAGDAWKTATHSHRNKRERLQTSCKIRCNIGSWTYTCSRPANRALRSPNLICEYGSAVCTQETASNYPASHSADCSRGSVL